MNTADIETLWQSASGALHSLDQCEETLASLDGQMIALAESAAPLINPPLDLRWLRELQSTLGEMRPALLAIVQTVQPCPICSRLFGHGGVDQ